MAMAVIAARTLHVWQAPPGTTERPVTAGRTAPSRLATGRESRHAG
jgi:hypothetical protein